MHWSPIHGFRCVYISGAVEKQMLRDNQGDELKFVVDQSDMYKDKK